MGREQISFTPLSMTISVPIFMISTNGSVAADTRPQTDNRCGLHIRQYFFLLHTEHLRYKFCETQGKGQCNSYCETYEHVNRPVIHQTA